MEDNYFLKTRNKIYEYLTKVNSIDKLMRDKVEPYVIIDELPIPMTIGGTFIADSMRTSVLFRKS